MKDDRFSTPTVIIQPMGQAVDDAKRTKRNRKVCFVVTTVAVTLAVIAGIVVAGLYLRTRNPNHVLHDVTITFHDDNGEELKEQLMVTGEEQIYTVPGKTSVIFNFKTGLMVLRNLQMIKLPCMMTYFNESEFATPKEMAETLTAKPDQNGGKIQKKVTNHLYGYGYPVKSYLISEKMAELCNNVTTTWVLRNQPEAVDGVVSLNGVGRGKRQGPEDTGCFICGLNYYSFEDRMAYTKTICLTEGGSVLASYTDEDVNLALLSSFYNQYCEQIIYLQVYKYQICTI